MPLPAPFAGKPREARPWVNRVRAYLRVSRCASEFEGILFASALLQGDAAGWFMALQAREENEAGGFDSFDEFAEALTDQFEEKFPADRARDRISALRQRASVASYAAELQSLLVHLPRRDEGDNVHTFIRGLKPAIARQVATAIPTSLSQAITIGIKADAAMFQVSRAQGDSRGDHRGDHPRGSGSGPQPMDLNAVDSDSDSSGPSSSPSSPSPSIASTAEVHATAAGPSKGRARRSLRELRAEDACYYCGQKGHFKDKCPRRLADKKKRAGDPKN
jgi:hypothetical protein